jgi:hypothetical protein
MANDAIFIARLLREFYSKSGFVSGMEFDMESTLNTIKHVSDFGVCLVGPTSCAAASISDYHYNTNEKVAFVLFWYFRRHREMAIFEALIDACKSAGATRFNAASLFPSNRIARFYKGIGMFPVETIYSMPLK